MCFSVENFDMPRPFSYPGYQSLDNKMGLLSAISEALAPRVPFSLHKMELPRKMVNSQSDCQMQPRSQGVLMSFNDREAERTPWYTSIKFAQNMGKFRSHYGFHRWPGDAKRRKMAVGLALIL